MAVPHASGKGKGARPRGTTGRAPFFRLGSVAILLVGVGLSSAAIAAACAAAPPQTSTTSDHISPDADGRLIDIESGLTWMRCAWGQVWDGRTCQGAPQALSWEEARSAAAALNTKSATPGALRWRLPRLPELAGIVEPHCRDPRIDSHLFPNTPAALFWSASLQPGPHERVYALSFGAQGVAAHTKDSRLYVRFVRGRDE